MHQKCLQRLWFWVGRTLDVVDFLIFSICQIFLHLYGGVFFYLGICFVLKFCSLITNVLHVLSVTVKTVSEGI